MTVISFREVASEQRFDGLYLCARLGRFYRPQAIRADNYQVITLYTDDNRSSIETSRDKHKHQNAPEPRFMRIVGRERFDEMSWGDRETGGSVFKTEWRDVDLSYDGKRWFHLMGGFCVKHERPFREK